MVVKAVNNRLKKRGRFNDRSVEYNNNYKVGDQAFSRLTTDSSNWIMKVVPLCQCVVTLHGKPPAQRVASMTPPAKAAQFRDDLSESISQLGTVLGGKKLAHLLDWKYIYRLLALFQ